jgi:hypothetical protein
MIVAGVMRQGRFCMSNAGNDPVSDWPTNRAGLEFLLDLRAAEQALEHDPEKWEPVFRKDHAQTKG